MAHIRDWHRPHLFDDKRFHIEAGRHPVVEAALEADDNKPFIANDCTLDGAGCRRAASDVVDRAEYAPVNQRFCGKMHCLPLFAQMGQFCARNAR